MPLCSVVCWGQRHQIQKGRIQEQSQGFHKGVFLQVNKMHKMLNASIICLLIDLKNILILILFYVKIFFKWMVYGQGLFKIWNILLQEQEQSNYFYFVAASYIHFKLLKSQRSTFRSRAMRDILKGQEAFSFFLQWGRIGRNNCRNCSYCHFT